MLGVWLWSSISRRYTTTGVTEPDHCIAKARTACRQCGSNTEGHWWHRGGFVIAVLLQSQQCPTVHVDTSGPVNRWTIRRAARDPIQSRLPRFLTPPLLAPNTQTRPHLCLTTNPPGPSSGADPETLTLPGPEVVHMWSRQWFLVSGCTKPFQQSQFYMFVPW